MKDGDLTLEQAKELLEELKQKVSDLECHIFVLEFFAEQGWELKQKEGSKCTDQL